MTCSPHRVRSPGKGRLPTLFCAAAWIATTVSAQCPQGADAALVPWSGPAGYSSTWPVDDEGLSPHALGFFFPMPNPNGTGVPVVFDQMWVGSNGEIYLTLSSALLPAPVGGSSFGCTTAAEVQGGVAGGSARVVPFGCDLMRSQAPCTFWQVTVDTSSTNSVTVTWADVALFTTGPSTDAFRFACTLHANGSVDVSYGTSIPVGAALCAVGLSTGNLIAGPADNLFASAGSPNGLLYEVFAPGTFDLAGETLHIAMNPGFTGYAPATRTPYVEPICASHCASGVGCYNDPQNGVYPLTLSAAPRPVRHPTTGVNFDYTIANVPEFVPCSGIGIVAVSLSIGQVPGGINLDFLGMPNCFAYVTAFDLILPVLTMPTASCAGYFTVTPYPCPLGLAVPNGFDFYAQALALVAPPSPLTIAPYSNALGVLTSNVVHSHVEAQ